MKRVIALGFFDGVHLGHGALLRRCRQRADELDCAACALTFHPHPDTLIFGKEVPLLTTLDDRKQLMKDLYAMDEVLVLPFDRSLMELPWQEFVENILVDRSDAAHVVCGHDFTFGHRGLGTAKKLQTLCESLHMGCDVIDKVELDGDTASSTRIRSLLQAGETEQARA